MKAYQVHPLSVTIGAIVAALLLFACSSGSGSGVAPSPNPNQSPAPSSLVSFYSATGIPTGGPNGSVYDFGTVNAQTVITDFHWSSANDSRLLVNGVTVFGWGEGGQSSQGGYAYAARFSLAHGIVIPAGASLAVEAFNPGSGFVSLAGYRP